MSANITFRIAEEDDLNDIGWFQAPNGLKRGLFNIIFSIIYIMRIYGYFPLNLRLQVPL